MYVKACLLMLASLVAFPAVSGANARDLPGNSPIIATDDELGAVDGGVLSADILNVLDNDTLRDAPPAAASVTITIVSPAAHEGVTLDPADGYVSVSANVPRGSYEITYRICETADPANCATALVDVPVVGLNIRKRSTLISDPVNGTANPKSIPGAMIRYCIQIENESHRRDVTTIRIADDLSRMPVTFVPGSLRVNAELDADGCDYATGAAGGAYDGASISWVFEKLEKRQTTALYFDVIIN